MNLAAALCELYDKNQDLAGVVTGGEPMLLPLYHSLVQAQITVSLDEDGHFLGAVLADDADKETLIPVTEKSASRTSGKEPHPLCDTLEYVAGDYGNYVEDKKGDGGEKYRLYIEQLQGWAESPYSHPKVNAIYRYLRQGTLMRDLYEKGIFRLDADGRISEKEKIQVVSQTKAFVRFIVLEKALWGADSLKDASGSHFAECWKDRSLQQCYVDFCRSLQKDRELSYLTGDYMSVTYYHPKKIRNEGDMAKLFSANDGENYTYRGRFVTKEEAFAIGYEDSQKMHNALKWLIRKQGKNLGSFCIVTWDSVREGTLNWMEDSETIYQQTREEEWPEEEEREDTGELDAARFRRALAGYNSKLNLSAHTMVLAMDAATSGRLSLVEYKDYLSTHYVQSIQSWYDRCYWEHWGIGKDKKRFRFQGMVGLRDMAELLYGVEEKGKNYFNMSGREDRYKEVIVRVTPCILEGKKVPVDMVRLAMKKASSPVSFDSRFLWERILDLACSLVRQEYLDKEEWTMALNPTCKERSYLFGRLLAVADRVEYRTYEKEEDGKRETNAMRYMTAFSQHPQRTWKMLEERLIPYWKQLNLPERLRYRSLLEEIYDLFEVEEFMNDDALDGRYLIGFRSQSRAFRIKNEQGKQEEAK